MVRSQVEKPIRKLGTIFLLLALVAPVTGFSRVILSSKDKEFVVSLDSYFMYEVGNLYQIKDKEGKKTGYGVVIDVRGSIARCILSSGKVVVGGTLTPLPPRKKEVLLKSDEVVVQDILDKKYAEEHGERPSEETDQSIVESKEESYDKVFDRSAKDANIYVLSGFKNFAAGLDISLGKKFIMGGYFDGYAKEDGELLIKGTSYGAKMGYFFTGAFKDGWFIEARYGVSTFTLDGNTVNESGNDVFLEEEVKGSQIGASLGYHLQWENWNLGFSARLTQYTIVMDSASADTLGVNSDFSERDMTLAGSLGYAF